jgi:hypothetical protein
VSIGLGVRGFNLPSVCPAFVEGTSKVDLFEAMIENIVDRLTPQPALFKSTTLFVVFDEAVWLLGLKLHPATRFLW